MSANSVTQALHIQNSLSWTEILITCYKDKGSRLWVTQRQWAESPEPVSYQTLQKKLLYLGNLLQHFWPKGIESKDASRLHDIG